jgi:diaminohydroxyphosphoribosylaminopyrimidine deaminase/5-amino-6-(5-phosphoribosylamino)uracil reductase
VSKVIIAMLDPNPLVSGKGVAMLKKAGIEVQIGLLENQANVLNRGFIKRMLDNRPFVTCKIAMSLDGKTSMHSGQSKWITGKNSRNDVQRLRSINQAILTGSGTVLTDNPSMTVRLKNVTFSPLRVVIDSKNQITDNTLNIFSDDAPTQIFNQNNTKLNQNNKLNLQNVLFQLAEQGMNSALLEAGSGLIGAMIEADLIDEFIIYTAPILMGSNANSMATLPINNMTDKINLAIQDLRMIGDDMRITAKIKL